MRSTHCHGCAFLVLTDKAALCFAFATYLPGIVRRHIGLKGVVLAAQINAYNNCSRKRVFSLRAVRMKAWARANMGMPAVTLRGYTIAVESGEVREDVGGDEAEAARESD